MTALRKNPYLPLYVQDFLSDEKLAECSAAATGVYIRLMCLFHKGEEYGKLSLREKDRQLTEAELCDLKKQIESKTKSKIESKIILFAKRLQRQMPYDLHEIAVSLVELLEEKVLILEGDTLLQKRMVRDGEISEKRSKCGTFGGRPAKEKTKTKTESKSESEIKTNAENEYEYENNIIIEDSKGDARGTERRKKPQVFTPPTLEEVMEYCQQRGTGIDPIGFFDFYEANGWVQGKQGKPVKDWKACVRTWERNGINPNRNGRQQTTGAAPTGGLAEVQSDTPAKATRHTTL